MARCRAGCALGKDTLPSQARTWSARITSPAGSGAQLDVRIEGSSGMLSLRLVRRDAADEYPSGCTPKSGQVPTVTVSDRKLSHSAIRAASRSRSSSDECICPEIRALAGEGGGVERLR